MGMASSMEWIIILLVIVIPVAIIIFIIKQSKKFPNKKVILKNNNEEFKEVKIGLSWTMFFFGQLLGIIWFMRGLPKYGFIFLVVPIIVSILNMTEIPLFVLISIIFSLYLTFWVTTQGNKITLKEYLKKGYNFVDENDEAVKFAKEKWNI